MESGLNPGQFILKEFLLDKKDFKMRILNQDTNSSINRIIIYLTSAEAKELRDSVEHLLTVSDVQHEHIPSEDFRKEISVTIYNPDSLDVFDDRSKRIILDDN